MTTHNLSSSLVLQHFTAPLKLGDFKLITFDMDSTLINIECIDEIADAVGLKAEVAAITEATMRGDIADFKTSLRRRVALLKGVSLQDMERVYEERLRLNSGATELVAACKHAGMKTLLVSGGLPFLPTAWSSGWGLITPSQTSCSLKMVCSQASWLRRVGAIFAMARKSVKRCWIPARCWASSRASPLQWAMAQMICQ